MNIPNWFYDERVQKIAPEKLTLLLKLAEQLETCVYGGMMQMLGG